MFYVSLMVITKKKSVMDTQTLKRQESKYTDKTKKSSNYKRRQQEERKEQRNYKTFKKHLTR